MLPSGNSSAAAIPRRNNVSSPTLFGSGILVIVAILGSTPPHARKSLSSVHDDGDLSGRSVLQDSFVYRHGWLVASSRRLMRNHKKEERKFMSRAYRLAPFLQYRSRVTQSSLNVGPRD